MTKKEKEEEKKAKENELNGPERMYQKYLSEIEKWNKRCNDILGDDQTEDTINYYKKYSIISTIILNKN